MWLPLALITAFTYSLMGPINKHQVKSIHPLSLLFINQCCTLFFMIFLIIYLGGIPHVTDKFFVFMICASFLDLIAFCFSYYAIRHAQISLLAPLSSLTPVFATIFGAMFLLEIPTPTKLLGIIVIVIGVYLLNISAFKEGIFKPFQELISNKGVRLYFVQVIIFGLTPIFQKQAIFEITPSMPIFASFTGKALVAFYLLVFFVTRKFKIDKSSITGNLKFFILYGILDTFGQFAAYKVFSMTHIGYATAIFSLASLFTILLGGLLFKESNIKEKLLGASVMIAGTILIAL